MTRSCPPPRGSGDIRVEHDGLSGAETRSLIVTSVLVVGCGAGGLFSLILAMCGSAAVVAVYGVAGAPLTLAALLLFHVPLLALLTLVFARSFEAFLLQPIEWSRRSITPALLSAALTIVFAAIGIVLLVDWVPQIGSIRGGSESSDSSGDSVGGGGLDRLTFCLALVFLFDAALLLAAGVVQA